ncbi:hypothetical protein QUW55_08605 [Phocaeicola barnesiae]|uniref:hypothetical protein n=1 Tax=Phocaeicola barnesiae TaxID=376804 RepID=UPI0025A469C6|nr:hypothetical protein [Phocaeicola barnesiae]MDM8251662.1 hypothetical protein [Phocaeicola barnesiae]
MKRSLVEEFENDIENALENLDYEIPFDIDSYITTDPYTDSKVGVVEVEFDYDEMDDCVPDSWDEDVEDAIDEAMNEWEGNYSWEDNKIICTIWSDDDDDDDDDE